MLKRGGMFQWPFWTIKDTMSVSVTLPVADESFPNFWLHLKNFISGNEHWSDAFLKVTCHVICFWKYAQNPSLNNRSWSINCSFKDKWHRKKGWQCSSVTKVLFIRWPTCFGMQSSSLLLPISSPRVLKRRTPGIAVNNLSFLLCQVYSIFFPCLCL